MSRRHRTAAVAVAPPSPQLVEQCALRLAAAAEVVFAALADLGDGLAAEWRIGPRPLSAAQLAGLQTHVFRQLDQQPAFESAGYVLTSPALADRERHLEWWHRAGESGFEPLILDLDLDAPDCYDYYSMEWFVAALDGHRRFVSGPLIDLPCADVCIMTFSQPVVDDAGTLLGIAGADVALSRLESTLLPPMRQLGASVALVNRERRVVCSNDARWTTGEKLPTPPTAPSADWHAVVPVTSDLGWRLVVAAD